MKYKTINIKQQTCTIEIKINDVAIINIKCELNIGIIILTSIIVISIL